MKYNETSQIDRRETSAWPGLAIHQRCPWKKTTRFVTKEGKKRNKKQRT